MEELTILMTVASLAIGAACFIVRKADSRLASLALVVSILAIGCLAIDETMEPGSARFVIALIAPLAVAIYSMGMMIFRRRRHGDEAQGH